MQVDCSPWHHEPLPRSWKYVSRSRGHSNWTCNATECLSMPTFDAFVVRSAWNCPCRVCRSSQNNRIRQNLSILSNDQLILTTSTKSLLWSSFFSSSFTKYGDCFRELQNTMTLNRGYLVGTRWRRLNPSRQTETSCSRCPSSLRFLVAESLLANPALHNHR